eukprot:TRINITY_DN90298_c0_g1_i1.p1 TRINITY_DN90298_c0_g1~~TRINITY_DN90298_c0_g1_i1.p1  ORF type:complete len:184 (-),score=36.67 TRINITY_DN90298_c0_g1_i1:42-551(-)
MPPDVRKLNHLSLDELKGQLEDRGLSSEGKKFTLVERLSQALTAEEEANGVQADPYMEAQAATFDPYLMEPGEWQGRSSDGDNGSADRSRSRSPRGPRPARSSEEKARAQALRRQADDICAVGLQSTLASLDVAVAAGSVPTKLLADLENKLSKCIALIEGEPQNQASR